MILLIILQAEIWPPETGSQSYLRRFVQQSRDAQSGDGDADTQLQNSHDDQRDVRSCQQVLIQTESRVIENKNDEFKSN